MRDHIKINPHTHNDNNRQPIELKVYFNIIYNACPDNFCLS